MNQSIFLYKQLTVDYFFLTVNLFITILINKKVKRGVSVGKEKDVHQWQMGWIEIRQVP